MFATEDRAHQPALESGLEESATPEAPAPRVQMREGDSHWLDLARHAYTASDNWFGASLRTMTERALANFRSVHPPGSKYHTEQYLKKSRIFRPKTRSAVRRGEAGHAIAFFSTEDVVHCSAVNEANPQHVLAAEIHNALLNLRLTDPKQFWFKTLIGGAQDAMVTGSVISKQCWDYLEAERDVDETYVEQLEGREIETTLRVKDKRVLVDRPAIKILPFENFRIDPAADWLDPVNSSPYTIELQPTYVYEIKARIRAGKYRPIDTGIVAAAIHQDWDSIRKAREGNRLDKYDVEAYVSDYASVWVRHHIVHEDGQDWVYDTLGAELMLMDPVPIEEYYLHCTTLNRPYKMGVAIIEAHKNYPGGIPQLLEDLQEEANDIANLRIDNVRGALNPRWIVRRGSGVDARGLIRNVPSGVTYANNITTDLRELRTQDVTASAFQEQDRLNLDMDDLVGVFSGGSVQGNRNLNNTVGGMEMLGADANRLEEYLIRTTTETWVESVMRDLVALEAAYESDEAILQVVADQNEVTIDQVLSAITQPVNVKANVGFNATNPQKRLDKLALGFSTINAYSPSTMMQLDGREVVKEVMGVLGYKNGARFFKSLFAKNQDPRITQLEQENAQLRQELESGMAKERTKVDVANINASKDLQLGKMKQDVEVLKVQMENAHRTLQSRIDQVDAQLRIEESQVKRQELFLEREALSHEIQESDRQFQLEIIKLQQAERHHARETAAGAAGKGMGKPAGAGAPSQAPAPAPKAPSGPGEKPTPAGPSGVIARDRYGMVPGIADGVAPP